MGPGKPNRRLRVKKPTNTVLQKPNNAKVLKNLN